MNEDLNYPRKKFMIFYLIMTAIIVILFIILPIFGYEIYSPLYFGFIIFFLIFIICYSIYIYHIRKKRDEILQERKKVNPPNLEISFGNEEDFIKNYGNSLFRKILISFIIISFLVISIYVSITISSISFFLISIFLISFFLFLLPHINKFERKVYKKAGGNVLEFYTDIIVYNEIRYYRGGMYLNPVIMNKKDILSVDYYKEGRIFININSGKTIEIKYLNNSDIETIKNYFEENNKLISNNDYRNRSLNEKPPYLNSTNYKVKTFAIFAFVALMFCILAYAILRPGIDVYYDNKPTIEKTDDILNNVILHPEFEREGSKFIDSKFIIGGNNIVYFLTYRFPERSITSKEKYIVKFEDYFGLKVDGSSFRVVQNTEFNEETSKDGEGRSINSELFSVRKRFDSKISDLIKLPNYNFFGDKNGIYYITKIREGYFKSSYDVDKYSIEILDDASISDWKLIDNSSFYSTSNGNVYYKSILINGSDASSFKVTGEYSGEDLYATYSSEFRKLK